MKAIPTQLLRNDSRLLVKRELSMYEDAVGRANGFRLWGSSKQQGNAVRGASSKVSKKHKVKTSGAGAAAGRELGVTRL